MSIEAQRRSMLKIVAIYLAAAAIAAVAITASRNAHAITAELTR